jgi:hypothetical protein
MDRTDLEPHAHLLISSYFETAGFCGQFHEEYGLPPTVALRAQHFRAVAQIRVNDDDRFELNPDHAEFGRLEFYDSDLERRLLVRSEAGVAIDRQKLQAEALFNATRYIASEVTLLVYKFHGDGLDLSVAGTCHKGGRRRLEASGVPSFVGTWPYESGAAEPFDQGASDAFERLGELGGAFEQEAE